MPAPEIDDVPRDQLDEDPGPTVEPAYVVEQLAGTSRAAREAAYAAEHPRARTGSARGRQISPRRVRDLISLSIRLGYLSPDDQLVEHELMELFNTSRTSVRAALAQLSESGMIERRPRAGTTIRALGLTIPLADIAAVGQEVYLKIIEDRVVPSFPLVQDRLKLDSEHVRMVENTFEHQGRPIGIRTAYFSQDFDVNPVEQVTGAPQHMVSIMDSSFGTRPGEVEVIIGVDAADVRDARLLRVPVGTPLVVREMTYYDDSREPIEIVFDRFRGDLIHIGGTVAV